MPCNRLTVPTFGYDCFAFPYNWILVKVLVIDGMASCDGAYYIFNILRYVQNLLSPMRP